MCSKHSLGLGRRRAASPEREPGRMVSEMVGEGLAQCEFREVDGVGSAEPVIHTGLFCFSDF